MKGVACALLAGAVAGYLATFGAAQDRSRAPAASAVGSAPAERGQPSTVAKVADVNAPTPERDLPTDPHELDVAVAEVLLRLTRLDLQKMTDLQNRVRGSITASQYDRVEGLLRVSEENYRLTKEGKATRAAMNVVRAREAVRTAEQVWKTAQQVKAAANAISDTELTRLRTMVELEKLMLAKAEMAATTDSPLDDLALEIDQMRDEMQRLRYRFEALTARR